MAARPLQERRHARIGHVFTLETFIQRCSDGPQQLNQRRSPACLPEDASLGLRPPADIDERAVAAQFFHAYGRESLHCALKGWRCTGEEQRERVAWAVLRSNPALARVRTGEDIYPLERAIANQNSMELTWAIFKAYPRAVRHSGVHFAAVRKAALPLLGDVLHIGRFSSLQPQVRLELSMEIAKRFAQDRHGLWMAMEAGVLIPPGASEVMPRRTLIAWRHGEAARRDFLATSLGRVLPLPAASSIAALLCGDCICRCSACRSAKEAMSSTDACTGESAPVEPSCDSTGAEQATPAEELAAEGEPAAATVPFKGSRANSDDSKEEQGQEKGATGGLASASSGTDRTPAFGTSTHSWKPSASACGTPVRPTPLPC